MAARNYATNAWKGYLCVILAATMWGTNGVVAKYLFNHGVSPSMLVQIRSTLAFLILFSVLALFKKDLIRFTGKDALFMTTFAIGGMAMVNFMYFYTISKTNVATGVLLQYTGPVFITIFAASFQGDKLTRGKIASLALAFGGCFLMVGGYSPELLKLNAVGLTCGLITALFYAFYTLYGEWGLKRYSPWTMVVYGFGFNALFWAIFVTPWEVSQKGLQLAQWPHFLYVVVVGTVIPFGLYFQGIKYIRATRASITSILEPVVAGVVSFFLLHEVLFFPQIIGGIAVIVAIVLLQAERRAPLKVRNLRSHDT
jgi:drug/metabolite transporter (DMT)-like permease